MLQVASGIPRLPWSSLTFDFDGAAPRLLGTGTCGRVLSATLRGEPVALKVVSLEGLPPADAHAAAAAFWREAELHYRLRSEHIVACEAALERPGPDGAPLELGLALQRMPFTLASWLLSPPPPSPRACARLRASPVRCATSTTTTWCTAT